MTAARNVTLRFEDLTRGFGRLAVLRGVDGAVEGGGALLVTGRNGSGKSTLLRCLAGLLAPQRGTIDCVVDGRGLDVAGRRRAVGWVAPDLGLYPELTCAENLAFFGRLRGLPEGVGEMLLERLGLPPERLAGALSSGMRQRLRWAFALLHEPPVLLLDEPLSNLDAAGRRDALALFEERLEAGALAVVASPDTLELPRVASRVELDR